ncbi:hypothetical protein N7454_003652 [Penicillium verhagenii]|nr:hypothetical protein N7454_003652 [Penicillium verhagenii]
MKKTDASQRRSTITLKAAGVPMEKICELMCVPPRTVTAIWKGALEGGFDPHSRPLLITDDMVVDRSRRGRPNKQTKELEAAILARIPLDQVGSGKSGKTLNKIAEEISEELGEPFSTRLLPVETPLSETLSASPSPVPSPYRSQPLTLTPLTPTSVARVGRDKKRAQAFGGHNIVDRLMNRDVARLAPKKVYERYAYDRSLPLPDEWRALLDEDRERFEIDMNVPSQVRDLISSFHQVPNVRRQFRRMYTSEGTLLSKYFHILDSVNLDPVLKKSLRRGNAIYETSRQHPHLLTSLGKERKRKPARPQSPPPKKTNSGRKFDFGLPDFEEDAGGERSWFGGRGGADLEW